MRKGLTDDPATVSEILARADVLWLALQDENGPHCVPVNFVEADNTIYVHSGKKGRKAACLDSGKTVAFSAAVDTELKTAATACKLGFLFKSVMGRGVPREVHGEDKKRGLDAITVKYAGKQLPYDEKALSATAVFAIDMAQATARIKE